MKNLQKAGGVSALVSAATYVFAIGLYAAMLSPLADPSLGIDGYMAFYREHRAIAYAWSFAMYIVHGLSLVVLAKALGERLSAGSPRLAKVAEALGMIWAALVLASGFASIWGAEALVGLYASDKALAETARQALSIVTTGIDSSDKLLGALWIGLSCLGGVLGKSMSKAIGISGLALAAAVIALGLALPVIDSTASFAFGIGTILWWTALGAEMLRRRPA